jgi:hypothetical protein
MLDLDGYEVPGLGRDTILWLYVSLLCLAARGWVRLIFVSVVFYECVISC